jgi:hypothetical protein
MHLEDPETVTGAVASLVSDSIIRMESKEHLSLGRDGDVAIR